MVSRLRQNALPAGLLTKDLLDNRHSLSVNLTAAQRLQHVLLGQEKHARLPSVVRLFHEGK